LKIEELVNWAGIYKNGRAMEGLPSVRKEIEKMPRQYIANVIYSLAGLPFKEWCNEQIEVRNKMRTEDHDLAIDMDPDIAKIFKASTAVSVSNYSQLSNLFIYLSYVFSTVTKGKFQQHDEGDRLSSTI
jgi:hypothetical protein